SQRLLAVLNVLFKYACARLFPPPGSRLVLTAFSGTSPRRVVKKCRLEVAGGLDGFQQRTRLVHRLAPLF
ncbi:MAG: hypothetical protein OXI93_19080, partial [Bryobacterales bacterium]|nr:hypothetical protein [Bryobacterales bacterium]